MTDRAECLICGRPSLSTGEPDCRCWTHSLSHPVDPPQHGPDPADVALFPLDSSGRPGRPAPAAVPPPRDADSVVVHGSHRPPASHRKPRERHRIAAAAGGAVAAVVGCTALAASLLGGNGRHEQVLDTDGTGPSVALPDGQEAPPDRGEPPPEPEGDTPRPGPTPETEGTERPDTGEPEPDPSPTTGGPDPTPTDEPEPTGPPATPDPTPTTPDPTTPPPQEEVDPVLDAGDEGPEVAELQLRLRQLNWVYNGEAHGRYDEETRAAVARFQSAYGVQGDPEGVYGPHTRQALEQHSTAP